MVTCLRLHNCTKPRTIWLLSLRYTVASRRQAWCKAMKTLQAWLWASPSRASGTTAQVRLPHLIASWSFAIVS